MTYLNGKVTADDKSVVIDGFTSMFNTFQVNYVGVIKADPNYGASEFADDLLTETAKVCDGYDGVTNNKDALQAVWTLLQNASHFQKVEADPEEKAILTSATPNYEGTGTNIENAIGRYNYLCKKYNLANFIGRTDIADAPVTPLARTMDRSITNNQEITLLIVVAASVATITIVGFFFLRKKKEK